MRRTRHTADQLAASSAALQELAAEHAALQERARHEEHEGREVAAMFRREMVAKGEALAAARTEIAKGAAVLAAQQDAAALREAALHAAFDQERQALVVAAGALQVQLDTVAQWQQDREDTMAAMARLRQENARIKEDAGEKVCTVSRKRLFHVGLVMIDSQVSVCLLPIMLCADHSWTERDVCHAGCAFLPVLLRIALQLRALQRRLNELEHGEGGDADGEWRPGSGSSGEEGIGDLCLEADLHRLLAQNRRAANEMRQYGQVRAGGWRTTPAVPAECAVRRCWSSYLWHLKQQHPAPVSHGKRQASYRFLLAAWLTCSMASVLWLAQEAEELQREMKALEEERASLLRNAALAGEMEAQYAKRGTLQVGGTVVVLLHGPEPGSWTLHRLQLMRRHSDGCMSLASQVVHLNAQMYCICNQCMQGRSTRNHCHRAMLPPGPRNPGPKVEDYILGARPGLHGGRI